MPWPLPLALCRNRRSLLARQNLVSAINFALLHPPATGDTYLVADPQPLTLAEIVSALRAGLGRSPGLLAGPAGADLRSRRWPPAATTTGSGSAAAWSPIPASFSPPAGRPPSTTRDGLAALTARDGAVLLTSARERIAPAERLAASNPCRPCSAFTCRFDHGFEPLLVHRQPRAVRLGMPQMQHAGGAGAVLPPHAGMQQPHQQVGILLAPAAEARVEAIHRVEVGAPHREIARPRALPLPRAQLAQRAERQPQHRREAVEAAVAPPPQPFAKPPALRLKPICAAPPRSAPPTAAPGCR